MQVSHLATAASSIIPIGLALNIFSLINIGGFSITLNLVLASTFLLLFPFLNLRLWTPLIVPTLWILVGLMTSMFNFFDESTITSLIQYVIIFLFFIFVYNMKKHSNFSNVWILVAVACSVLCIFQLAQIYFGLEVFQPRVTNLQYTTDQGSQRGFDATGSIFDRLRMPSTFAEPSDFGRFLIIAIAFSTQLNRGFYKKITQVILVFGVTVSLSFGAIIIGLIAYFVSNPKYSNLIVFPFLFLFSYLFYDYLPFSITSRVDGLLSGSIFENSNRFKYFSDYWIIIQEKPLLGWGIGSADRVFSCCVVANYPINFIGEYGLIGFSLYLIFWSFIGQQLLLVKAEVPRFVKFLVFFLLFSLAWKPQLYDLVFWTILAYSISIIKEKKRMVRL